MKSSNEFYQGLHKTDKEYSAGTYHMASLWSSSALQSWIRTRKTIRLLDVGCGKGVFLRDFVKGIGLRWQVKPSCVTGIDLVQSPNNHFAEISPEFEFRQHDTDGNPLPFPDQSFDFVCCNHVLEHVFETENLVREFRRVLAPDGFCMISVPNIAAWVNRVAFLFAGQPLGSELGTDKVTYGFRPAFMQKKLEAFHPSGHIRDFTPPGLRDLTAHCGFETVGWWSQSHGLFARLSKWGGRNISILLRPKA
jgi:ubiquinone/menaquinone biosynthesis C-methylase UbiE